MLTGYVDKNFPKWAMILLVIFGDATLVYRILLFVDECIAHKEKKHYKNFLIPVIALIIPFVGWVLYLVIFVVDLVTVIKNKEITFLVTRD